MRTKRKRTENMESGILLDNSRQARPQTPFLFVSKKIFERNWRTLIWYKTPVLGSESESNWETDWYRQLVFSASFLLIPLQMFTFNSATAFLSIRAHLPTRTDWCLLKAGHQHRDSGKCHLSPIPVCTALTSWTSIHGCFWCLTYFLCWKSLANAGMLGTILIRQRHFNHVISVGITTSKRLVRVSPALPTASVQLCFCCHVLIKHSHSWQLYHRECCFVKVPSYPDSANILYSCC